MKIKKNQAYQDALAYVFQFIDYSNTHQENLAPENFNLTRMRVFLAKLDNPQNKYKSIHVAGTKGKGSVSALCAGALQVQGYKVGLYTSPHLHEFTERIQINREPVSQKDFSQLVEKIKPAVEQIPNLTSYEIQTALAFLHFANEKVDIAVVEVGLGGRLDSTNVIHPLVSVITSLSLDHTFILGNRMAEIAREKGGIIKENTPVVSAPQLTEASNELKKIAHEKAATYTEFGDDISFQILKQDVEGQTISINEDLQLKIKLLGPHQAENAALAYAALNAARQNGLELEDKAINLAFSTIQWPGRFEIIQNKPLVIFDGAHNQYSASMLVKTLKIYFPNLPTTMIFGSSDDKDIDGMFEELLPNIQNLIPVCSSHPRAAKITKLIKLASAYPCQTIDAKSILNAYELAIKLTGIDGVILITGSLYLVGEAREAWLTRDN